MRLGDGGWVDHEEILEEPQKLEKDGTNCGGKRRDEVRGVRG